MAIISPDLFSLKFAREDDTDIVRVVGELDVATAPALRQALNDLIDHGNCTVRLDLARMTFIDSTGLSVLLGGLRRLREAGGELVLVNPSRSSFRVLEIVRFTDVFTIIRDGEPAGRN